MSEEASTERGTTVTPGAIVYFFIFIATSLVYYSFIFNSFPVTFWRTVDPTEDSMACTLPSLDPWHLQIAHLFSVPEPPRCPMSDSMYSLDYKARIISKAHNWTSFTWTNCCYKVVGGVSKKKDLCHSLNLTPLLIPPEHELLTVWCVPLANTSAPAKMIQALAHTPLKAEVEARVGQRRKNGKMKNEQEQVNLVIHLWDSMSAMEFRRCAPRLRKFLTEDLGAFWFDGYHKVGVNTSPNLKPLLLGLSTKEYDTSRCNRNSSCPVIWHKASISGYRTSIAYDAPAEWPFTSGKFPNNSTHWVDYDFRPLSTAADKHLGHDRRKPSIYNICFGPQLSLQSLIDYMKAIATSMGANKRYFQFTFSGTLTHDFNMACSLGESPMLAFLNWMKDEGHLNRTILIFLGDHGLRTGRMSHTPQGDIENSMPMLYFLLPAWFEVKYPSAVANLRANQLRLTSHYDTHVTFHDILDLSRLEDHAIHQRTEDLLNNDTLPRGISLFLPIPKRRTCAMANIGGNGRCVCNVRTPIPVNSSVAWEAALQAVAFTNQMFMKIKVSHKCANLTLSSVQYAQFLLQQKTKDPDHDVVQVGYITIPGNGSFDAIVKSAVKAKTWSVLKGMQRTNLYGNQSYCVGKNEKNAKELKNYCFCYHK